MDDASHRVQQASSGDTCERICSKIEYMIGQRNRGSDSRPGTIIAIVGPTGVGKSRVADRLAVSIGAEVVSADSMQVYRGMDIGTAKVAPEARGVAYHCIDIADPGDAYSASLYQRDARAAIDDIVARGKSVVVCGGTGLYVRAALDAMEFPPGDQLHNPVREHYEALARQHGNGYLHDLLAQVDPRSAALIHPNNVRRVVRAFEMLEHGASYADQAAGFSRFEPFYDTLFVGLSLETGALYEAIDARVDAMLAAGLLDEVRTLQRQGYARALTASQAIGYKEYLDYLGGSCTLDQATELVKRRTRRYSKRQRTWFKRDARISWFDVASGDLIAKGTMRNA